MTDKSKPKWTEAYSQTPGLAEILDYSPEPARKEIENLYARLYEARDILRKIQQIKLGYADRFNSIGDLIQEHSFIVEEIVKLLKSPEDNSIDAAELIASKIAPRVQGLTSVDMKQIITAFVPMLGFVNAKLQPLRTEEHVSELPPSDLPPTSTSIPKESPRNEHGEQILWASRKTETKEERAVTPASFIQMHYAPWLGKGITRADINRLDPQLYSALTHWIKKNPLPDDFGLPKGSRALPPDASGPTLDEVREARRILGRWTTRQAARQRAGEKEHTK